MYYFPRTVGCNSLPKEAGPALGMADRYCVFLPGNIQQSPAVMRRHESFEMKTLGARRNLFIHQEKQLTRFVEILTFLYFPLSHV